MHTLSVIIPLLATTILAAPKPLANPQYNQIAPAAQSTAFITSIVCVTTTEWQYPSSTTIEPTSISASITSQASDWQTVEPSSLTPTPTPEPEALAGVYICEDINWAGNCTHHLSPLGSGPDDCTTLHGDATSIGPDWGFTCTFFTNFYCDKIFSNQTDFLEIMYPGIADLRSTEKGDFNDSFWSYVCLRTERV